MTVTEYIFDSRDTIRYALVAETHLAISNVYCENSATFRRNLLFETTH